MLSTGRIKKKNAGEVSITILSEIISWYYPETKTLTIYSQDGDTYDFQRKAEADLRKLFAAKMPVPISYKSNDAILCQLVREGKINIVDIDKSNKKSNICPCPALPVPFLDMIGRNCLFVTSYFEITRNKE